MLKEMKTDELWSLYRESNYIAYSVILAAVPDLMRLLGELTTLFLFRKKKKPRKDFLDTELFPHNLRQ